MKDALLVAHLILCAMLIFTVFCRAVRTDHTVRLDVRFAFFCMGIVACLGIPAPLIWSFTPTPFSVLLLAGIVLVQLTTSRHWKDGVPYSFYKPDCRPGRRSCEMKGGCRAQQPKPE